ncbi:ABC transporter ATP-binding protein [Massilia sp. BJB1822]|uniref:ABC transporter ATP-binding protein n=1 Tax=Massilia sp. BJB1822 TaxID=2744470 RepID=UPI0015937EA4|nr:ABC transporter transmembrane domain-containing protein [Massilia sp. BJB1822]NVE00274.1 ATP-binding cassette domain-containing protein [Massilia sp. BJB1822]
MTFPARKTNPHLERLQLLRPFAGRLALGLFFMVLTVMVQLAYPKAIAYFIDGMSEKKSESWFIMLGSLMLGVFILQAIATTLRYYLFESTGYMIVTRIRRQLFGALIGKKISFFDRHNVGELSNRLTADVEVLHETLTMGAAISLRCLCILIGGVTMLLIISPALTLMLAFFIPASLLLSHWGGKRIRKHSRNMQQSQADCGKTAYEHLANIRLVHAFNQGRTAARRYGQSTEDALNVSLSTTRMMAAFRGWSIFLVYMSLLVTLWFGAKLILEDALTIGELTAFILYSTMVTDAASAVTDFWSEWMRTIGATERIFELIGEEEEVAVPVAALALQGNVAFRDVVFAYPERPDKLALRGISFTIAAGEKIALVGASGAGKSTIASMLLGFYEAQQGSIGFDGTVLTPANASAMRDNIAIVEQEPSLFSGSIYENIAFAVSEREASLAEVMAAARLANAHDFIQAFPQGYETIVGERGVQLSGGQKQRVAIARALLRNPRILILDEATSALDSASEVQVQNALDKLMAGRTTIIIAHRYSTIVKADRILVLDQGCIAQQGSHRELMQDTAGLYHYLMENQLAQYKTITEAHAEAA